MENLWAPWRMEYVTKVDDDHGACFICAAHRDVEHDQQNLVVYRTSGCICLLNRFPYSNGHLLVAPNAHKQTPADLCDAEHLELQQLLTRAIQVLNDAMSPQGFNVGLNLGRAAGAGLPGHLHWHVVPRWSGDTNFMPVLGDVKVIPQALDSTWQMLYHGFKQLET